MIPFFNHADLSRSVTRQSFLFSCCVSQSVVNFLYILSGVDLLCCVVTVGMFLMTKLDNFLFHRQYYVNVDDTVAQQV